MTKLNITMFYGEECQHCHAMFPLVKKLQKEDKDVKFKRLEVWYNKKNQKHMLEFEDEIRKVCGGELGTPAFVNEKTKKSLCGEIPYKEFKKWATSQK